MTTSHKSFTWLHISDLHTGIDQSWLWPRLKQGFLEDIQKIYSKSGPWDVVIFSGDLTQKGAPQEFSRLTETLLELWQQFQNLGFSPRLFTVPGNHDLVRPDALDSSVVGLTSWWQSQQVQDSFWTRPDGFGAKLREIFDPYSKWLEDVKSAGLPVAETMPGIIPGDSSTVLSTNSIQVGIVGLNSSWLQIDGADYKGKLNVDIRQLHAVTRNDPQAWCKKNRFNLLVTHHPLDWLHGSSQEMWQSDINPAGLFFAHLFGHMHEQSSYCISQGGGLTRRSLQAASLFGLERLSDGSTDRAHGYYVAKVSFDNGENTFKTWPRRLRKLANGDRKLGPDLDFDLDENNCAIEYLTHEQSARNTVAAARPKSHDLEIADAAPLSDTFGRAKHHLIPVKAHLAVRKIERQNCIRTLSNSRALWISADWGMGRDGFLWSVQIELNETASSVYRVDLPDYKSIDHFLDQFQEKFKCSFPQFCDFLSSQDCPYLLLDDLPVGAHATNSPTHERDLEQLVATLLNYCPSLKIFLASRISPLSPRLSVVILSPLDEADTRAYVLAHERGGESFASPNSINRLYRHTDGVPNRIDSILRDLDFMSLTELASIDSDLSAKALATQQAPPVLVRTISELVLSADETLKKAFGLLKVLAMFPQGEQLSRVKRILGLICFYPPHARELLDRGLIDSVQTPSLNGDMDEAKLLVVRRPVREYLFSIMTETELLELNSKIVSLYFGEKWRSGVVKFPSWLRFDKQEHNAAEIQNANMLVQRLFRQSHESGDNRSTNQALNVTLLYMAALTKGDHYRATASLCDDLRPYLDELPNSSPLAKIQEKYGYSLRMISECARAKDVLLGIETKEQELRQQVFLELALCHQALDEDEKALEAARNAIAVNPRSSYALQAEEVILEVARQGPQLSIRQSQLERKARKSGAIIVANNIALTRANQTEDESQARDLLDAVLVSAVGGKDPYNEIRAIVALANLNIKSGYELPTSDQRDLVRAYHYLYQERRGALFNDCHAALWHLFEKNRDVPNLLRLFRHSSLIWRLRGQEHREMRFLQSLAAHLDKIAAIQNMSSTSREAVYFMSRTSLALKSEQKVT